MDKLLYLINTKHFHAVHFLAMLLVCIFPNGKLSAEVGYTFTQGNIQYQILSETGSTGTVSAVASSTSITGDLIIPSEVTNSGITYTVTTIPNNAFSGCWNLNGTLSIPESVTFIGASAFKNCSHLTGELSIPKGIKIIYRETFRNCTGLTGNLSIPDGVTNIGKFAFYGCTGLTGTLSIPESVTSIGESAFSDCSGLTGSFYIPKSMNTIPDGIYYNCKSLTGSLSIPEGVISIGESAFSDCSGLTGQLIFPNTLTSLGALSFAGCAGLTGPLNLPDNLTQIGEYAFSRCTGLESYHLPKKIKLLSNSIFSGCTGLTGSLSSPEGVTSIGSNAFSGCTGLTGSLSIPESVTSIGSGAFSGCTGLTGSLSIPESVTSIGQYCFQNCSGFDSFIFQNRMTSLPAGLLYGCTGLTGTLTIPESVTSIGNNVFSHCTNLQSIVIPQSVKTIGGGAFAYCTGLTHVTLPSSLTQITDRMIIENSENLKDFTLPNFNKFSSTGSLGGQQIFNNLFFLSDISNFKQFHNIDFVNGKFYLKPSVYAKFLSSYDNTYGYYPNFADRIPVTFPSDRYFVTMCRDFDVDFRHTNDNLPSGVSPLKAYIVSDIDEASNAIILQEIKYVPSRLRSNEEGFTGYDEYVGVLLKGTPGHTYYYTIGEEDYTKGKDGQMTLEKALALSNASVPTSSATLVGANDPKYVTTEETVDGTTYKTYGLKNNEFCRYSADGYVPYNKAYLRIPATYSPAAKEAVTLIFHDADGTTTSVSSASLPKSKYGKDFIYDLQGMRIASPAKGKVYIKNGKKRIQK